MLHVGMDLPPKSTMLTEQVFHMPSQSSKKTNQKEQKMPPDVGHSTMNEDMFS